MTRRPGSRIGPAKLKPGRHTIGVPDRVREEDSMNVLRTGLGAALCLALVFGAACAPQSPAATRDYDAEIDEALQEAMLAGRGDGPHPYDVGAEGVQRYFTVMQACARAAQLRLEKRQAETRASSS
jgi:hypothetical protein